jgi:hypothetical protein
MAVWIQRLNHASASDADAMAARERERRRAAVSLTISGEDVPRLAEVLRAAERAHAAYMAELWQADVEPVQDWAAWYAEYLLGVR